MNRAESSFGASGAPETGRDTCADPGPQDPDRKMQLRVPNAVDRMRLDAFLASQTSEVSRGRIRQGIDSGLATVDGQRRKAAYRLSAGQLVSFVLPDPPADRPQPEPIPLELLYEDDSLVVINKPAGMVVHPAKGHWSGTLASALVHHFDRLSQLGGSTRPGIAHRLDRDTTGVILVAKTDAAHQHLAHQFQSRTVKKVYLAICVGNPDRDRDLIDQPIGKHRFHREKKAIRPGHASSREAQTFIEVAERFPGIALFRAFPKTGRTHQVRLHLQHIRCPVLCDKLYGGRAEWTAGQLRRHCCLRHLAGDLPDEHVLIRRQALHAERITIVHPTIDREMEFQAPVPDDMRQLLQLLREDSK